MAALPSWALTAAVLSAACLALAAAQEPALPPPPPPLPLAPMVPFKVAMVCPADDRTAGQALIALLRARELYPEAESWVVKDSKKDWPVLDLFNKHHIQVLELDEKEEPYKTVKGFFHGDGTWPVEAYMHLIVPEMLYQHPYEYTHTIFIDDDLIGMRRCSQLIDFIPDIGGIAAVQLLDRSHNNYNKNHWLDWTRSRSLEHPRLQGYRRAPVVNSGIVVYNNRKMVDVKFSEWAIWMWRNKDPYRGYHSDQDWLTAAMGHPDIPITMLPPGLNYRMYKPAMQKCEFYDDILDESVVGGDWSNVCFAHPVGFGPKPWDDKVFGWAQAYPDLWVVTYAPAIAMWREYAHRLLDEEDRNVWWPNMKPDLRLDPDGADKSYMGAESQNCDPPLCRPGAPAPCTKRKYLGPSDNEAWQEKYVRNLSGYGLGVDYLDPLAPPDAPEAHPGRHREEAAGAVAEAQAREAELERAQGEADEAVAAALERANEAKDQAAAAAAAAAAAGGRDDDAVVAAVTRGPDAPQGPDPGGTAGEGAGGAGGEGPTPGGGEGAGTGARPGGRSQTEKEADHLARLGPGSIHKRHWAGVDPSPRVRTDPKPPRDHNRPVAHDHHHSRHGGGAGARRLLRRER